MPTAIVNGVGLYHEEHGSGFPLVLLMGFGDDCGAWSQQLPAFSARYRTIVYDHRGVGRSDKPQAGYSIRRFSDDAIGLLDHLDVPRAHLLGYSMGGRVAQDLAARYPSRVASIVLASSAAKPNALNLYCLKASAYLHRTFGPEAASAFGPVISFTHAYFTEHLSELTNALGKPPADLMPNHALEGHVRAIEEHDTTPVLGAIKAPTLVLMGDQEWLNPRSDADELLALAAFSAAARKCRARDEWIGWDFRTQHGRLHLIANNARFLILPGRGCPNLGSRVLGLCARRLARDWPARFGHPLLMLESFVDSTRFRGTVSAGHPRFPAACARGRRTWFHLGDPRCLQPSCSGVPGRPHAMMGNPAQHPPLEHGVPSSAMIDCGWSRQIAAQTCAARPRPVSREARRRPPLPSP